MENSVEFRLFKVYTMDDQKISVVSMVDDMTFEGTLEEFCDKFGNKYDNNVVCDPVEHDDIIVFELF